MKHFVNILTATLAAILTTACSSEDLQSIGEATVPEEAQSGLFVSRMPFVDGNPSSDGQTRSVFYYKDNTKMQSEWDLEKDILGIIATKNGDNTLDVSTSTQASPYKPTEKDGDKKVPMSAVEGYNFAENYSYTAYFPYEIGKGTGIDFTQLPMVFESDEKQQTQTAKPNMSAYFADTSSNRYENADYQASEKNASKHLGDFDYMYSTEQPYSSPAMHFPMKHLGCILRFYFLMPTEKRTITRLDMVAQKSGFYKDGTFTLTSGSTGTKTAGTSTNTLSLKLAVTSEYAETDKYGHYIVAYLMMYPVTISEANTGKVYFFVTATDDDGNTYMYKSRSDLLKYLTTNAQDKTTCTMESGKFYQWATNADGPVLLDPLEIEEFTPGTDIENEGGKGTQGW